MYNVELLQKLEQVKTENELFDLWGKAGIDCFVRDGIFSENNYGSQKVLFILRDAHIVKEKSLPPYDIRDIVKKPEGEGRTWNNVARWTQVLLDKASYSDVEDITPAVLSTQLKRVAAINLKKEAGGNRAERIKEFASKHRCFIKKQIELINPDVIIACGTFPNLKRDVFGDNTRSKDLLSGTSYKRYDVFINDKKIPIVGFYHPQFNKKNEELVKEMLKIREAIFE